MKEDNQISKQINQLLKLKDFTGAIHVLKSHKHLSDRDEKWSRLENKINRQRFISKSHYHSVLNYFQSFERFNWLLAFTFLFFFSLN